MNNMAQLFKENNTFLIINLPLGLYIEITKIYFAIVFIPA